MGKLEREYNKKCHGAWRMAECRMFSGGLGTIELENVKTGERMTYELTGWTADDSAYIDSLCGYKGA